METVTDSCDRCVLYVPVFCYIHLHLHLADAFIQSDLHCIQVTVLHFISSYIYCCYILLYVPPLWVSLIGLPSQHWNGTCRVLKDLLMTTDSGSISILILLDLCSVFDTISHSILISHLSALAIFGTALSWLISYLSDINTTSVHYYLFHSWCSSGFCAWFFTFHHLYASISSHN